MPRTFADMVLETSATLGTGLYELQGPIIGYRAFKASYVTGDQPYYVVRNALDTKFEINRGGTFTTSVDGDTLTRNVILSSNANAAILWQIDDHPLAIYCPRSADSDEGNINGWLSPVRNALIKFGLWWKKDAPAVGTNLLSVYDGTVDIPFVHMNTATHVLTLDGALGGASIIASATPPATPHISQLWFNSDEASLYVWYNDGNTTQWVPAMPIPAPNNPPVVVPAGWRQLGRVVATASQPYIEFLSIPTDINDLMLHMDVQPVDTQVWLGVQMYDGVALLNTHYYYQMRLTYHTANGSQYSNALGANGLNHFSHIILNYAVSGAWNISNLAGFGVKGRMHFYNIRDAARNTGFDWQCSYLSGDNTYYGGLSGEGFRDLPSAMSGVRLIFSSGGFQAGSTATLWGSP